MRNKILKFLVFYVLFSPVWITVILCDYSINDLTLVQTIKNIMGV